MSRPKIALAMIVKGDDKEAELLDRCLSSLKKAVDGIFITSTHKKGEKPNKRVRDVSEKYGAEVFEYEWTNHFADARNFSFSQVPEYYDYIMWSDADDVWRSKKDLHEIIEKDPADAYAVYYLYAFDEYDQPSVAHSKTMVVKNDGSFSWVGAIHEDLQTDRNLSIRLLKDIDRLHLTDEEKINSSTERNLEIAEEEHKQKPEDPRTLYNLGNAQLSASLFNDAIKTFEKFIEESGSDEEIYLAHMRLSTAYANLDNIDMAKRELQNAIGKQYDYPDAYLHLGYLMFNEGYYDEAERALLNGLSLKPLTNRLTVFNPRDYDYNPLKVLAKVYIQKNNFKKALVALDSCIKINPKATELVGLRDTIKKELEKFEVVDDYVDKFIKAKTKKEKEEIYNSVPSKFEDHPKVCVMRNQLYIKKKSSGKDIAFYCGLTEKVWSSKTFKKEGMGGSEESVVHLATQFAKKGWNVSVYNNCGPTSFKHKGISWNPYWKFNHRDKQDVIIAWRSPLLADYDLNCDKLIIDLHDVISPREFTAKRLEKIHKVYVKTNFHRSLFENIPDNKIAVIPNGLELPKLDVEKDEKLIINTSSPDRSMSAVPEIFKEIKKVVPDAKMKWAYGFDIFDIAHKGDKEKEDWKEKTLKELEEAGVEVLGRITQDEVGKLYKEANVMLYPSEFAEIDCISVKKAQGAGCIPVTTDFGAFEESVQHGVKIPSDKTKDNWCPPGKFDFGVKDPEKIKHFADEVANILLGGVDDRSEMIEWAKKYDWSLIADKYLENI